jgi:hypothetical protein
MKMNLKPELSSSRGHAAAHLVQEPRYMLDGRGFDSDTSFLNSPNPFNGTMALGSTQAVTKIGTWSLPGARGRPARKAINLTVICEPIV